MCVRILRILLRGHPVSDVIYCCPRSMNAMRWLKVDATAIDIYNPPSATMYLDANDPAEIVLGQVMWCLQTTPDLAVVVEGTRDGTRQTLGFARYHFSGSLDVDITGWKFSRLLRWDDLTIIISAPTGWRFSLNCEEAFDYKVQFFPSCTRFNGKIIPTVPAVLIDAANRACAGLPTNPALTHDLLELATLPPNYELDTTQVSMDLLYFYPLFHANLPLSWVAIANLVKPVDLYPYAACICYFLLEHPTSLTVSGKDFTENSLHKLLSFDSIFHEVLLLNSRKETKRILQQTLQVLLKSSLLVLDSNNHLSLTSKTVWLLRKGIATQTMKVSLVGPLLEYSLPKILKEHPSFRKSVFPIAERKPLVGNLRKVLTSSFPDRIITLTQSILSSRPQCSAPQPGSPGEHLHIRMNLRSIKPAVSRTIRIPTHEKLGPSINILLHLFGWEPHQYQDQWTLRIGSGHSALTITPDECATGLRDIQLGQVLQSKTAAVLMIGTSRQWVIDLTVVGNDIGEPQVEVLKARNACPRGVETPSEYQELCHVRRLGRLYLKRNAHIGNEEFQELIQHAKALGDPRTPNYAVGYKYSA